MSLNWVGVTDWRSAAADLDAATFRPVIGVDRLGCVDVVCSLIVETSSVVVVRATEEARANLEVVVRASVFGGEIWLKSGKKGTNLELLACECLPGERKINWAQLSFALAFGGSTNGALLIMHS